MFAKCGHHLPHTPSIHLPNNDLNTFVLKLLALNLPQVLAMQGLKTNIAAGGDDSNGTQLKVSISFGAE